LKEDLIAKNYWFDSGRFVEKEDGSQYDEGNFVNIASG